MYSVKTVLLPPCCFWTSCLFASYICANHFHYYRFVMVFYLEFWYLWNCVTWHSKCWLHVQGLYLESCEPCVVIRCATVQLLVVTWERLWLHLLTFGRYDACWYGSCSVINVGHSCNLRIVKLCLSCTYIFHQCDPVWLEYR